VSVTGDADAWMPHHASFGAEPGRPRTQRLNASPDRLRAWQPARCLADRRHNRNDNHADDPARRCGPACARAARRTPPPLAQAVRRPRLTLTPAPARSASARRQREDCLAQRRARFRARQGPLGGRAHDRLAPPVPTPPNSLRAPRRHPRSLPRDRQQPDLPQAPIRTGVTCLGVTDDRQSTDTRARPRGVRCAAMISG